MVERSKIVDELRTAADAAYSGTYQPSLIRFVPRAALRDGLLDADADLPFRGEDVLVGYELGWLNPKGRPEAAVVALHIPCGSPHVIEAGSLQRYLQSFSQTEFLSRQDVQKTLELDLGVATRSPVLVNLLNDDQLLQRGIARLPGTSLDTLDGEFRRYERDADALRVESEVRHHETVHTQLLRCLCPLTGLPDVGSAVVRYAGRPMEAKGLLGYFISLRRERLFLEELVERVFVDLMAACEPEQLTVEIRFLRRGSIEVSGVRSTQTDQLDGIRLARQ